MRELVRNGDLGKALYFDSQRVNLGLFQRDVNVIADLAVHDFSILDYVFGEHPTAVSAAGINHYPGTPENLAYITMFYESGFIAHVNVSWLAPVKLTLELIDGICVVCSARTCVVEKSPNCVEENAPMPVVVNAETCVVVNDWMEVVERLWMAVVDSERICATDKAEIDMD